MTLRYMREREAQDHGDGRGIVHGDAGVQPADAVEIRARDHLVHDRGHDPREMVQEGLRRGAAVEIYLGEGVDLGAGDGGPGVCAVGEFVFVGGEGEFVFDVVVGGLALV